MKKVCWNTSTINSGFFVKKQEILSYLSFLSNSMISYSDEIGTGSTDSFINAVMPQYNEVKDTENKFEEKDWCPCLPKIKELKSYLGPNLTQNVSSIILFCQECISYLESSRKDKEREKTKRTVNKLRSCSPRSKLSPSPDSRLNMASNDKKENISNFANRNNINSKLSPSIQEKLKGPKKSSNPKKTSSFFSLKNQTKGK